MSDLPPGTSAIPLGQGVFFSSGGGGVVGAAEATGVALAAAEEAALGVAPGGGEVGGGGAALAGCAGSFAGSAVVAGPEQAAATKGPASARSKSERARRERGED